MRAAKECLRLFDLGGPGTFHQQAQRFLSRTYSNGPEDPGLRPLVVELSEGASVASLRSNPDLQKSLVKWLGAFRLIRTNERNVEGTHSLVSRELKRAPNSKVPSLSFQLRFPELRPLMTEIALHPQVTWRHLIVPNICTHVTCEANCSLSV